MTASNPGAAPRCRACAAEVAPGADRCARCGAAQREDTCPHCGATAGASPHDELRLRCDVCGGPRAPLPEPPFKRSGREVVALQRAHKAASSRSGWRAASVAGGLLLGFDTLLFSLLLLIAGASFGLLVAGLATLVPLAGFLFLALRRGKARGREIEPALHAAWLSVATDIARQADGALAPSELAAALRIDEPQAEELLALIEVNDIVVGGVTAGAGPRVRVGAADGEAPVAVASPGALAAEEEALAAEEVAGARQERSADVDPTRR